MRPIALSAVLAALAVHHTASAASPSPHADAERIAHAAQTDHAAITDAPPTPPRSAPRVSARPCRVVFAYLPYWSSAANADLGAITHLACFGVDIGPDGRATDTNGWPWTTTAQAASAAGVRVVLVVKNFSPAEILALLQSSSARARFRTTVLSLMQAGGATGLNIDFEGATSNGWTALLPAFLAETRAHLRQAIPDAELSIAAPAVNWSDAWPLTDVAAAVDHVFVMGYDFNGSWSSTTGPSAPLTGGFLNITDTLTDEYAAVLATHPERLVLGMPLYGNTWRTNSSSPFAAVAAHLGTPTYASARTAAASAGRRWDSISQTPWYRTPDGSAWRQTWYDDEQSLALKIDFAESLGIAGFGFWALGYEGSDGSLWSLVRSRAVDPCTHCPADLNDDGLADFGDVALFVSAFSAADPAADLNDDGLLDFGDVAAFVDAFNTGC